MSAGVNLKPVLEVKIEISQQHSCPYDPGKMEKMFRELLLRAGYNEGTFRVKPGKFIHGTSRTAKQGITIGIPFEHALSCEIQTKSNDSRCEALLFPPAGMDVNELARVLTETAKVQKRKPVVTVKEQGADGESEPVPPVPPDEEDVLLLEEESLTKRLHAISQEQTEISKEEAKLNASKALLVAKAEEQTRDIESVQSEIRECEERLANLQTQNSARMADQGKTQKAVARKNSQIKKQINKSVRLQTETDTIRSRIETLHARMAELDRDRRRQSVLEETAASLSDSGLAPDEQLRLAEELLAKLRTQQT